MRCCAGDGGMALRDRPAGGGLKPPQAAAVKSRGGERCGKGARDASGAAGKANVSEPLLKRRKRSGVIKTGVQSLPREEPGGCLLIGQVVTGVKVARARFRHWHGTWEPVAPLALAGCWAGQPKGVPRAAETARGGVPVRGTGADRLVVAVRPGNAGGAKGTGCPGSPVGQPAGPGGAG